MNEEFDFTGSDEDQQSRDNNEPWVEQGGENSDEEFATDKRAYTPQLMDTQEMQALRAALIRSEAQIQEQGHMKEYVPHKHVSSRLRRWYGLPRNHLVVNRPVMSAGPLPRFDSSFSATKYHERPMTSMKPAPAGVKTTEFAKMLKEEARQVRELERRYGDTKRSLLDYIEVVTSCKLNDRVGGQEVFEQLAELMAFATQCNTTD